MSAKSNLAMPSALPEDREAALDEFLQKTIGHPHLNKALAEIEDSLWHKASPNLIVVTGPTGVGKTTLAEKLENLILERTKQEARSFPGRIPVVHLSASTAGGGPFSWKELYTHILGKLDRLHPQQRLPFPPDSMHTDDMPFHLTRSMPTASSLQSAVESAIKHRGTRFIIIDEANQILQGHTPKEMARQFETIKSLSILTKAVIVLVGTYDLLAIRNQSAQLVRRSRIVQLPRYCWEVPEERDAFCSTLLTFASLMRFQEKPDFRVHAKYFCLKSAGCIGILKLWLNAVVDSATRAGRTSLDLDTIKRYARNNLEVKTILEEAFKGERQLVDFPLELLEEMTRRHHLDMQTSLPPPEASNQVSAQLQEKSKKAHKPGTRLPKRDKVGLDELNGMPEMRS